MDTLGRQRTLAIDTFRIENAAGSVRGKDAALKNGESKEARQT
jgi:hypothetical protein